MHLFTNGVETFAAPTMQEAVESWEEDTGESRHDYGGLDDWRQIPEDEEVTVWLYERSRIHATSEEELPRGSVVNDREDGIFTITAKARDWLAVACFGFFSGQE